MLPVLNRTTGKLLYEQLYEFYKDAILTEKIAAGYRLVSVRKLAKDLAVSNNTVIRAYEQLEQEGYIISKPKKGLFIQKIDPVNKKPVPGYPARDNTFITKGKRKPIINLGHSTISEDHFPIKEWRKVQQLALDDLHHQYDYDTADAGLKEQLIEYLYRSRGVVAKREQLIICAGTNQLLSVLCMLFKDQHSAIFFEEPGFEQARFLFSAYGYTIKPIPVNSNGLDISLLDAKKARLLYVTPSHQYPTGVIMPISNRIKLLSWAQKNNAYIIEDDYESEFRYTTKPIPAMQAIDQASRVIYMGTFSKILLPTLRVAYMILPEQLLPSFYPYRYLAYSVSYQIQKALAIFMEKGYWQKHLRKMQKVYRVKFFLTVKGIKKIFGDDARIISLQAGLSILIEVNTKLPEPELLSRAGSINIFVKGASVTYLTNKNKPRHPRLFIGFGNLADEQIPKVVGALHRVWFQQ